ncbi:MFS transporter [Apilactobacillus micheneri]|uniref:MFS transporter n=1 Tax=Apilactobacillus micheneri TaxID=1899430 RepID=A0ABY2YYZ9_9LACO|nr:MDR family MFS transporter [Apilactobacillus micheneri]TPR25419.1 MFS transporter [Apilactobacillus micheneri]TPR26523.1 MFS transporter [Apilactobacillus micheneri]TPR28310.1 MFS transporter [Apilactobacillus micheneri]TPR28997.1 MFS transporter [Apilactobacillus micheneri]TPR30586.1 MFS transporter [Apilactobacillus micheneri]
MIQKNNRFWITMALFLSTFVGAISITIVSTSLPSIVGDIHGVSLMNWVFSIFLLTSVVTTPIYGKLSDQFGRKKIFLTGLLIFLIGSFFSGISNNMEILIFWRAIQGIGSSAIMPMTYTIISDIYPFNNKSKLIGINGAIWGISLTIAPLLGGIVVDTFNWRWIFFINIPIIILSICIILLFFKEKNFGTKQKIDYLGIIYLSLFLFSIMYVIQLMDSIPNTINSIYYLIIISLISLVLFIRNEYRTINPLIPMSLFNNKTFIIQNIIILLMSGFVFGLEIYLPIWIQGIMGLSASFSGLAITPISIFWIIGSFFSGWLLSKSSASYVTIIGSIFTIISAVCLILLSINSSIIYFFVISSLCGIGFGLTITNSTVTSQNIVEQDKVGVATSFNSLSRILGQTFIISILEIVMNRQIKIGTLHSNAGITSNKINEFINYKTHLNLSENVLNSLKNILYNSLHEVFLFCLIIVILVVIINLFDKKIDK